MTRLALAWALALAPLSAAAAPSSPPASSSPPQASGGGLAPGEGSGGGAPEPPMSRAAQRLQALLRVDTTNPPGGEALAARLLAGFLRAEGLQPELVPTAPGREAVVCRLRGLGHAPPLLLLGHLDVVEAEAGRWRHPPFGGLLREGKLWGRGALDMKGLVIMELEAFLAVARSGRALGRDLIFAATPDEEAGGEQGVAWLLRHRPELIRASEALNEGGAGLVLPGGQAMVGIQCAERGALWLRVRAQAAPGHGAQERPDSAPRRLLRALARLEASPRRFELGPETQAMLLAMAEVEPGPRGWALRLLAQPWAVGALAPWAIRSEAQLAPLLSMTLNPTVLRAGAKVNVVPGEASAELDLRLLPGHRTEEAMAWVREALGDPGLEVEATHRLEPSRSPAEGPLYAALAQACREAWPGVPVAPILTPGGSTDSSHLRPQGVRCYGLMPMIATSAQLATMHGDDEHLSLAQLDQGVAVLTRALELVTQRESTPRP